MTVHIDRTHCYPNSFRKRLRIAFTLVELLVVIAIIGIMTGMLLPAVQAVRETARRSACASKMAHLAIAAHDYEYAMERFPTGVINSDGGPIESVAVGQHIGHLIQLLPYIEQTGVANLFDAEQSVYAAKNAQVRRQSIRSFLCPATF